MGAPATTLRRYFPPFNPSRLSLNSLSLSRVFSFSPFSDQVDLDLKIKNLANDYKSEHELLAKKSKEKDLALRQYKALEAELKETREALPNLKFQVEQVKRDRQALEAKLQVEKRGGRNLSCCWFRV
jgi:septal ring factor EnvC (AmiA/AmiB activator)